MSKRNQTRGVTGINQKFSKPDEIEKYVDHFQREDREIYARRFDIIQCLNLKSTDRVADIGCGTGEFSQLIASQVSKLFYIDIFPHFLEQTAVSLQELSARAEPVLSDGTETGLPPCSVDVVFTSNTYHHFEQPEAMLKSIHRTLASGGKLYLIDLFQDVPATPGDLPHVRGDREQFCSEIVSAGFVRLVPPKIEMQTAYLELFEKVDRPERE